MSRALIITMRNPVKGKVKTRLAASVGEVQAFEIYLALLSHVREVSSRVAAKRYLYYSDFANTNDDWPAHLFFKKRQRGENLGERMANALEAVLKTHSQAVLIGTDIPQLSTAILEQAFERLSDHDFVIGPAEDGGYYLIGMKTFHPSVFQDITWGTSAVFKKTVERMEALGKSWFELPVLPDVDTEEDWEKHGWSLRAGEPR